MLSGFELYPRWVPLNHSGSIICETSSPLLLLVWEARMKLNSKKSLESLVSLPSFFGYLGKGTKDTAEHVIMNKIFIYVRACLNKDFVHSSPIGLTSVRNVPKFKVTANWSRDTFQPMRRCACVYQQTNQNIAPVIKNFQNSGRSRTELKMSLQYSSRFHI